MKRFHTPLAVGVIITLALAGCQEGSSPEGRDENPSVVTKRSELVWREGRDLVRYAEHAFYVRDAAYFGPGLPGWRSISGAGREGVWGDRSQIPAGTAVNADAQDGSWMSGRAGSLRLPIARVIEEGGALQFWFFGVVPKQAVSIFLDGENIGTIDLSLGWKLYDVSLPKIPAGEHRLRFWFRRVQVHRGLRTPGALGRLRLGRRNLNAPWPSRLVSEQKGLLSEPGGEWHFYLTDLRGARGRLALETTDNRLQAQLSVIDDTNEEVILLDEAGIAKHKHIFDIKFPQTLSGGARLVLKTRNHSAPAKWTMFNLERLAPSIESEPPSDFKRLVFVILDGVGSDELRFGRAGTYPVTPAMDELVSVGNGLPRVFTGGDTLSQRVDRVMRWSESLMARHLNLHQTALFSEVRLQLSSTTLEWVNRYVLNKPDRFSRLLDEIEMWLKLQTSAPSTLAVVLSGRPKKSVYSSVLAVREHAEAAERRPMSFADAERLTYLDQKLSRLLGLLSFADALDKTVVIVMGHKALRGNALDLVQPQDFFSPLVMSRKNLAFEKARNALPSLDWVLSRLEQRSQDTSSGNESPRFTASRWVDPLTAILNGQWLLLLQDAKRYRLFKFGERWENKKQTQPITQRAMRVLLDQ